jgi:hypothetical protein
MGGLLNTTSSRHLEKDLEQRTLKWRGHASRKEGSKVSHDAIDVSPAVTLTRSAMISDGDKETLSPNRLIHEGLAAPPNS